MMLQERIQNLFNFENSHSQDNEVIAEQEEEEKFDFDSHILDTSGGAMVFIPDAKRYLWVILLEIPCLWKLSLWKEAAFRSIFSMVLRCAIRS